LVVLIIGFGVQSSRWADRISPGELPYPVYIVTGVAFWQTFADALLMPHRQLSNYRVELARRLMTVEQALVGWLVMCASYIVLSFVTYVRAQCTDTMPIAYSSLDLSDIGDSDGARGARGAGMEDTDVGDDETGPEKHIVDVEKKTLQAESESALQEPGGKKILKWNLNN
jgi:hypothetical protein